jgi:hypothetical protein
MSEVVGVDDNINNLDNICPTPVTYPLVSLRVSTTRLVVFVLVNSKFDIQI